MDDSESRQPLGDDRNFFDRLSELDEGLDGGPQAPATTELPVSPIGTARLKRRPPVDVFPPAPAQPSGREPREHGAPATRQALTYEAFYGLNEQPFSLSADPRFLYHSAAHDRVSQQILDAIGRRDGIILLTGDIGSGKTTLCRAVIERIDRRTFTSFVLDPFVTIDDLLKTILVDFGVISGADLLGGRLSTATRHELVIALRDFLLSLVPLKAFAVVIIDEAQNLSVNMLEQVRVIADIQTDRPLLQLVLVGQPNLLTIVKRPELAALNQRVTLRCDLEPLCEHEIAGYVSHRLMVAGGATGRVEFGDDAFALMYALTGGLPRLVNRIGDRVLTRGFDASTKPIDRALVESVAHDLDLVQPARWSKPWRYAVVVVAVIVVMLGGAAAATVLFPTQLGRAIVTWEAVPPPPPPPVLRRVAPIEPYLPPVESGQPQR